MAVTGRGGEGDSNAPRADVSAEHSATLAATAIATPRMLMVLGDDTSAARARSIRAALKLAAGAALAGGTL